MVNPKLSSTLLNNQRNIFNIVIQKCQISGDISFDLIPLQKKKPKEPNKLAKKGSHQEQLCDHICPSCAKSLCLNLAVTQLKQTVPFC